MPKRSAEPTIPMYVRTPGTLRQALERQAGREKRTLTDVAISAFREYLERHGKGVAKTRFFVWGRGDLVSASAIARLLEEAGAEHSEAAVETAKAHGFKFQPEAGPEGPDWAVEVECDQADLDAATRFEPRVHGYAASE